MHPTTMPPSRRTILPLAIACLLAAAASASSQTIYETNFNAQAPGGNPPGWMNTSTSATSYPIVADPLNPDTRALSTPGGTNRTTGAYYTAGSAITATASGGLKLSFALYIADTVDSNWNTRWFLQSGTLDHSYWYTAGYGFLLGSTGAVIYKTSGGGVNSNPGSATTLATVTVPPGTYTSVYGWTNVEFEWRTDGTLILSLNGRRVAMVVDLAPLSPTFRTLSTVSFLNNSATNGSPVFTGATLKYDNILVSQIPYQTTLESVAVGSTPSGWMTTATSASNHVAAADPVNAGNRVLSTAGGSSRTTGAYYTLPSAVTSTAGFKLAFDIYTAGSVDSYWNSRWYLGTGSSDYAYANTPGYGFLLGSTSAILYKTTGGGTYANQGSVTPFVTRTLTPANFTANGWTRVELEWYADGFLTLSLNGTMVASYVDPAPLAPAFRTLSTVSFLNNAATNGSPVFTGATLKYDNIAVSLLPEPKEEIYWLVWDATAPESGSHTDPVLRSRAVAATDALAAKLSPVPANLSEINILLNCIHQWWVTGTATPAQLKGWLTAANSSVELRIAASNGAMDPAWSAASDALKLRMQEVNGPGIPSTLSLLTSPSQSALVPGLFAAVPAAGVHPRILISASELPAVRARLSGTACGISARGKISGFVTMAIGDATKPLRAAYDRLVLGDLTALSAVNPADAWWKNQMSLVINFQSFLAMIDSNTSAGVDAGKALVTYSQISQGLAIDGSNTIDEQLGYAYDYAYGFLTDPQRSTVRGIIASVTSGKVPFGADMPPSHRNYNIVPHGMHLLLMALAIEGEAGYDDAIYPKSKEILADFLNYGTDAQGAPLEDMHYFHFGMAKGAPALVAMARRGDNLFANDHYRKLHNWLVQAIEPFGNAFSMHDDTPDDKGGLASNYIIMKWVWPTDPIVNLIWKNRARADYSGIDYRGDFIAMALFPSNWTGSTSEPTEGVAALNLPAAWMGQNRALFIARNQWDKNATVLHVECSPKLKGPSHIHANNGDFTLSALGRKWAIDRGFHISESKEHSLVLVDGVGQGNFAPPGRVVEAADTGSMAFSCVDSRYPYAWQYTFQSRSGSLPWEPEIYMGVREWFAEMAAPQYQSVPWDSIPSLNYTYKKTLNPMERAFRTVALRRGARPYVLVLDDIKKDASTHTYDWLMQVPNDIVVKSTVPGGVILGSTNAAETSRLLVQTVESQPGTWTLEDPYIVTNNEGVTTSGKRLKFSCSAVSPNLKMLLFPHVAGAQLPTAQTLASPARLQVAWSDQTDLYSLPALPAGRTGLTLP